MQPSLRSLARLARKYRTLGSLRRAKARGEAIPERAVFRDLAAEFPGALTELDTLHLDEIDRRADLLERAAEGGDIDPWMAWLHAYHALARAALHIRLRGARARGDARARPLEPAIDPSMATSLAAAASERSGIPVDDAFVQAVLRPPGGRVNAVLYERLSIAFGVPAPVIKRAIFPGLRRQAV
jgi:hypothetical protein